MDLSPDEWIRRIAERYSTDPKAYHDCWAPSLRIMSARLAERVTGAGPRRVLDVGAGTGALLPDLRRLAPSSTLVAADLTEAMLRLADRSTPRVVADVTHLPFGDGGFDVAIMAFMLFHVPDPVGGLREVHRILAPGGRVGVATWAEGGGCPALDVWEEELDAHGAEPTEVLSAHERTDTPEKVRSLLQAAGFRVESVALEPLTLRLTPDQFWEQRLRLGTSRSRLESLPEDRRTACLGRARARLSTLGEDDFRDRSSCVLAVARTPAT